MAGGGTLGAEGGKAKRGKHSKRKKKKRIGFKLDMTPLVDITFLLLTFFMFTTTMLKPHIMEMQIPPENEEVKVKATDLLTLEILKGGKVYWFMGTDTPELVKFDSSSIRKLYEKSHYSLKDRIETINSKVDEIRRILEVNELITVLKIADDVSYEYVINMLDYLNLSEDNINNYVKSELDILLPQVNTGDIVDNRKNKERFIAKDKDGNNFVQDKYNKKITRQRRFTIAPLTDKDLKQLEDL